MVLLPDLLSWQDCLDGGRTRGEIVTNVIILFISIVPAVFSQTFKYRFLSKTSIDIFWLNFVVSFIQFLIGMILAPIALELQYVSAPSESTRDASKNIFTNFARGFRCLGGNTDSEMGDLCEGLGWQLTLQFILFVLTAIGVQFFMYQLARRIAREAVLSYITFLSVLLAFFAFYIDPVQDLLPVTDGVNCLSIGPWSALGCITMWCGLLLTSFGDDTPIPVVHPAAATAATVATVGAVTPAPSSGASLRLVVGGATPIMADEIDVWAQFEALEAADEKRAAERKAKDQAKKDQAASLQQLQAAPLLVNHKASRHLQDR